MWCSYQQGCLDSWFLKPMFILRNAKDMKSSKLILDSDCRWSPVTVWKSMQALLIPDYFIWLFIDLFRSSSIQITVEVVNYECVENRDGLDDQFITNKAKPKRFSNNTILYCLYEVERTWSSVICVNKLHKECDIDRLDLANIYRSQ